MATAPKQTKSAPKAPPKPDPDVEADDEAPPPKKKRGKLIFIILAVLILAAAGGGAGWYFSRAEDPEAAGKPGAAKAGAAKSAKAVSTKPPVFVPLDQFTVNLQYDDTNPQYLQVALSIKVSDSSVVDAIKLHIPEIRNRVLMLLSGKRASDLVTVEGKTTLSTELVREISAPLAGRVAPGAVEAVLFTSFVIQ